MPYHAMISVFSPDRVGLVSAITGRLFDMGANLGDTTFAVLGEGAEFAGIVELPDEWAPEVVERALAETPALADAQVHVRRFGLAPWHGPDAGSTHEIRCEGPDQPGLVARLTEVFIEFEANILRMDTEMTGDRKTPTYVTRFAVSIPERRAGACLATLSNVAHGLGQSLTETSR